MCTCTRFKGLNTGWNTVSKWQQNHWPAGARTRTSPKPNWQVLPKTCSNEFPPNLSTRPFRLTSPCSNNRWNCTQGRKPGHRQCGNEGGTQIHPVQNPGPHYRSAQLSPQRTRDLGDQCGHGRDPRENDKFGRPSATNQPASASRGIRGEAILTFKVLEPSRVRSNALKYSADNGETWHNGTYSSSTTIRLKGLPSRQALLFRVCSLGTYQRKSAWTEAVEGFVV